MQELRQHVPVDVYGECGKLGCPRDNQPQCDKTLSISYKFYLSFENSNCEHYVTEKFFHNALRYRNSSSFVVVSVISVHTLEITGNGAVRSVVPEKTSLEPTRSSATAEKQRVSCPHGEGLGPPAQVAYCEIKTKAVLSQGGPRDAAVHFDTYRISQRHRPVSQPQQVSN